MGGCEASNVDEPLPQSLVKRAGNKWLRARHTPTVKEEFEGGEFVCIYPTRDKESASTLLTPLMCLTTKLYSWRKRLHLVSR